MSSWHASEKAKANSRIAVLSKTQILIESHVLYAKYFTYYCRNAKKEKAKKA
jgi:hypothetical protein